MTSISKRSLSPLAVAAIAGAVIVTAGFSAVSEAEARPSTKSYTCSGVKSLIKRRGAVVMNHKNSSLYRRFVQHRGFCDNYDDDTQLFRVPTKSGSCNLRICVPSIRRESFLRFHN